MNFDNLIVFHYQYWCLFRQDQSVKFMHLKFSLDHHIGWYFSNNTKYFCSICSLEYIHLINVWFLKYFPIIGGNFNGLNIVGLKKSFKLKKYKIKKCHNSELMSSQNIPHFIGRPLKDMKLWKIVGVFFHFLH